MPGTRPADILRHLDHPPGPDAAADGDLLARFARHRDQAAFAALVRRHGPVVLGVCRRITHHPQDAEDAFQAVFLVLARKAAAVHTPHLLGNWLYGVAVRVARKARRAAARRRAWEVQVVDVPEPSAPPAEWPTDGGVVLHEELAKLAAKYRDAIVLCDLRGVSRAEAAKALGIPEGTLSSRLAGGRKQLADRLTRRGVALAAAAMPATLTGDRAVAAVPDSLVSKTCGLVADWAAGGVVPATVFRLAQGGFPVRKLLLLGVLTTALTAVGVVFGDPADPPKRPDPARPVAVVVPAADPKPDEKRSEIVAGPRMRKATNLPLAQDTELTWSHDGKSIAIWGQVKEKGGGKMLVRVTDVFGKEVQEPISLAAGETLAGFTPDGRFGVIALREYNLVSGFHRLTFLKTGENWRNQVGEGKVRIVDLDADQTYGYAFALDGRSYRTIHQVASKPGVVDSVEAREMSAETGKTLRTLAKIEGEYQTVVLAANGKRIAVGDATGGIAVWNLDTGMKERTPREKAKTPAAARWNFRFSADSRFLAVKGDGSPPEVYDNETGKWGAKFESNTQLRAFLPLDCFSADNRLLAVAGFEWNANPGPGGFGPSSSEREFLKVWDTETGKLVKTWNRRPTLAWSPVGRVLAVAEANGSSGTRLGLWDFAAEAGGKK